MDDIFVGRLMSSPVQTADPDAPLHEAGEQMLEHGIGSVVVTDDDGQLEGILTATDFVRLAAERKSSEETAVSEFMTEDVVTTTANESIRDIADLMLEHGFHHMPVVDEEEGVVGIVTTTDLTAYLSHVQTPSPA